jgi:hypothetical protein
MKRLGRRPGAYEGEAGRLDGEGGEYLNWSKESRMGIPLEEGGAVVAEITCLSCPASGMVLSFLHPHLSNTSFLYSQQYSSPVNTTPTRTIPLGSGRHTSSKAKPRRLRSILGRPTQT